MSDLESTESGSSATSAMEMVCCGLEIETVQLIIINSIKTIKINTNKIKD